VDVICSNSSAFFTQIDNEQSRMVQFITVHDVLRLLVWSESNVDDICDNSSAFGTQMNNERSRMVLLLLLMMYYSSLHNLKMMWMRSVAIVVPLVPK
jgi:hypothetical protein